MRLKGFTLLEIIMSVGIIALVASFSIPAYSRYYASIRLEEADTAAAQFLREARERSLAGYLDSGYGVHFILEPVSGQKMVYYKGSTFDSRDASFDKSYDVDGNIGISSQSLPLGSHYIDINFSKYSGLPSATGSLAITHGNYPPKTISINSLGIVTMNSD